MRHSLFGALLVLGLAAPAAAQSVLDPPPVTRSIDLSGPRFGLTMLSQGVVDRLRERAIDVRPAISQFGWQFERQFYRRDSGVAALNEWIVLFGGLEQDVVIPSFTWMVGLRSRDGLELGIGPNVTPGGVALAMAAGVTVRAGVVNVPVNVAVVPSKVGTRVSILTGFNMRR